MKQPLTPESQILISQLQAIEGLAPYQVNLRDSMISWLRNKKFPPCTTPEAHREVRRLLLCSNPAAELRKSADPDEALKKKILGYLEQGDKARRIRKKLKRKMTTVLRLIEALGIQARPEDDQVRQGVELEPMIDLTMLYCDREIQLAVFTHSLLNTVGINVLEALDREDVPVCLPSECSLDGMLLSDIDMSLRDLSAHHVVNGGEVDAEQRKSMIASHVREVGDNALIVIDAVSERPEDWVPWLKSIFPKPGHTICHADCPPPPGSLPCDLSLSPVTGDPANQPTFWFPKGVLAVIGMPELTKLGAGLFPTMQQALDAMKNQKQALTPSAFCWAMPKPTLEAKLWHRIKLARSLRSSGMATGLSSKAARAYDRQRAAPVNHSSKDCTYSYGDGLNDPDPGKRIVTVPWAMDWQGWFRAASPESARPLKVSIATIAEETCFVTSVYLPGLLDILFSTIASLEFAEGVTAVRKIRLKWGQHKGASDDARYWLKDPFGVQKVLQKLEGRDPAKRAMAVGIALTTFGADFLLVNMTNSARKRCHVWAAEVNLKVVDHLDQCQSLFSQSMEDNLGDKAGMVEKLYNQAKMAFATGQQLVIRSFLNEARRAFTRKAETAAEAGVALRDLHQARELVMKKYGFHEFWPVLEWRTDNLVRAFRGYFKRFAKRAELLDNDVLLDEEKTLKPDADTGVSHSPQGGIGFDLNGDTETQALTMAHGLFDNYEKLFTDPQKSECIPAGEVLATWAASARDLEEKLGLSIVELLKHALEIAAPRRLKMIELVRRVMSLAVPG